MSTTQNAYYDKFFGRGGWKYDLAKEERIVRNVLMPLGRWKPKATLVEVGAGMCHHSEILRRIGMRVTAVEASAAGVQYAKRHYPKLSAVCADASTWSPSVPVGHVFARGMSFFHYELGGINCRGIDVPKQTARMFDWLAPGGTFMLQIVTDFSGKKGPVHNNRLSDYVGLFSRFGKVLHTTDFSGKALPRQGALGGIVIVTCKEGG